MPQSERWRQIGREILFSARTELYMSLPFLDAALGALAVTEEGYDTDTLATDARHLYFSGAWLAMQLEHTRTAVNRSYLHSVFPLSAAAPCQVEKPRHAALGSCM